MSVALDRVNALTAHGLTEPEARAYLALLDFPTLAIGPLAKAARISRPRLYAVIGTLQALDLVEVHATGRSRRYSAKPISAFLDRRLDDLRARIEALDENRALLEHAFQPAEQNPSHALETGALRVLLSRRAVANEIDHMLENARRSILFVGSPGGTPRILHHLALYLDMTSTTARLEIFLPRNAPKNRELERSEPTLQNARALEIPHRSLCLVTDEENFLMIQPIPDDGQPHTGHDFAFLSTNPLFVRDYVELVRNAASPPRTQDAKGSRPLLS